MTLPYALQAGIDDLVGAAGSSELECSAQTLSERYRAGGSPASRAARTVGDVAAYLATRAPATYAAAAEVFDQIRLARPNWAPASVLDLGAGPGIATWAAVEAWPGITTATLLEAEPEMINAGRSLAARGREALRGATWTIADAGGAPADLVILSYLIGELEPAALRGFVDQAWSSAADTLVVVEPGTTAGYRRVLEARDAVIAAGGSTLAPCPHDTACPLPAGDWCHFAARLARSRIHRRAKGAERGFEDEKFAYAVLCRSSQPHARSEARVIRRPDPRPGHVVLELCTPSGIERRTVSRREGDAYRSARKLRWGDAV